MEESVKATPIFLVEPDDVPQLPLDILHVDLGVVQDTGHHQAGVKAPCEVRYEAWAEPSSIHCFAAQALSVTEQGSWPKSPKRFNFNL